MAVSVTAARVVQGSEVNDSLSGPNNPVGAALGAVQNGSYAPVIDQSLNTGVYNLYFRHNATIDPITNVVTYVGQYGVGSGNTYAGAKSPSQDYSELLALGLNSDGNKNNTEDPALGGGLRIDMDAAQTALNKFDYATNGMGAAGNGTVAIYGKDDGLGNDGSALGSGFAAKAQAMAYDSGGSVEAYPSSPQDGVIGRAVDATTLGSDFKAGLRIYLPSNFPDGGITQIDYYLGYSFTA